MRDVEKEIRRSAAVSCRLGLGEQTGKVYSTVWGGVRKRPAGIRAVALGPHDTFLRDGNCKQGGEIESSIIEVEVIETLRN